MLWTLYSSDPIPPVVVRVPCHTPDTFRAPLSGICALATGVQNSIAVATNKVRRIAILFKYIRGGSSWYFSSSGFQVRSEKLDRPLPRILCVVSAIDAFARIIEEAVRTTGVNLNLAGLVEFLQRRSEPINVCALNPSVVFAVSIKSRASEIFQLVVRRNLTIERRCCFHILAYARQ